MPTPPIEGSIKDGRTVVYLHVPRADDGDPASDGSAPAGGMAADRLQPEDLGAEGGDAGADAQDPSLRSGGPDAAVESARRRALQLDRPALLSNLPALSPFQAATVAKAQAESLRAAALAGSPFCEDCERFRREALAKNP